MSQRSVGSPSNPVWGDSVMSIELTDDFQLQDYPLRLGVCSSDAGPPDHGFVTINLEQILHSRTELDPDEVVSMKGWFPLFDTMTGVRGHILVSIKMQFVGDQSYNDRFASSVGVRFFSIACPPQPPPQFP
ncbi:C2cd5 [Symbiodinium necroappetens]|uniref:C2cd5 protein n=1 Tax=Symbiodinium necroappetens TaxID=1628268 RepID=A0A812JWI5_9DINO|nr:C2cd5 [Symbiodinium necroappetens]